MGQNNKENVVKFNGKCINRGKWKFCYYWRAKHSKRNKAVIGYFCDLFNKDKEGYTSLPECNSTYGKTYDGKPQ